jgi:hypothetical protein
MITISKIGLTALVLISLISCTALNNEIGYMPLKNSSKASIDAWIIDGQTTKDQIRAYLGPYKHDSPSIVASQQCKQNDRYCIYMVNVGSPVRSNSFVKSVTVTYNDRNIVTSHKFSETRL